MNFEEPEYIDNKYYYIISNETKKLLNINENHFPVSLNSLKDIIDLAIAKYNNDVYFITENSIEYMIGNTLGRQIEYLLSLYMHLNDANLEYKQGNEGTEPDLTCLTNNIFSIEVKTSKTLIKDPNKCRPIITGNSSYAKDKQDETSKKTKNHFYILINYKYKNCKITDYKAWFGFIKQEDWLIPNKGGASKLDIDNPEVQKRIVEIL
jgi:hypothetical protein